jgi:cation diffusion facilitator CzcD-associated flavoprotein CzcO
MHGVSTPRIAVVGAGFGGLAIAFELERQGIHSFEIYERANQVGGVWRENTYPGAGCDVPSPFYSFSYEPNPDWPSRYSNQSAILEYIERCVDKFGVRDRIHLNSEVTAARFDENAGVWELTVGGATVVADVLVCACGQLSEPAYPKLEGRETFAGHSFHSAIWDHDHDLQGRRVAVIGSGASTIQFLPEIAPEVERLYLFQRSAPYIILKPEREYSARHHRAFRRFPWLLSAERLGWYLFTEYGGKALINKPGRLRPFVGICRTYLYLAVRDPEKRRALVPDHKPGCKRLLFSKNYYQALARENVEIIGEDVTAMTEGAVVSSSGKVVEVDTVIYATGFQAHGFVAPMQIVGRAGRRLAEDAWADGASAYLGLTVPGFPNMFITYGPNTNLGSGSIIYMHESSARYVASAIAGLEPGVAYDVRQSVFDAYDAEIQERLATTVWASGCHSWYIDERGRNANNWPGSQREYRRRTARFDPESYELVRAISAA